MPQLRKIMIFDYFTGVSAGFSVCRLAAFENYR